jgi:hypothetical protein
MMWRVIQIRKIRGDMDKITVIVEIVDMCGGVKIEKSL